MATQEDARIARLEAELAAARTELQDLSRTVSHDLRAPLRHILAYAQIVQEDAGPQLDAQTQQHLATITGAAQLLGAQLDGLLELSRLGTVALHTDAVPLRALVQDVLASVQAQHPQRDLQWQIAADLPDVQADAALLRLALQQVLDNAVKFTAPQATAHITVTASTGPDRQVTLKVQDNGVGFNPGMRARLFHPFQRLHSGAEFKGMGMGLALTRKMLERMGGAVDAQGIPNGGCTLALTLPLA